MGNRLIKMMESRIFPEPSHEFLEEFDDFSDNGLFLNNIPIPEEVLVLIVSYMEPKDILKSSLVCKRWFNITRSHILWSTIYSRKYKKKALKYPWYVYYCLFSTNFFDTNLLKNGNGEEGYKYWDIIKNNGDEFVIEKEPKGSAPKPLNIPEFNETKSCFVTSFYTCSKIQEISIIDHPLLYVILNTYKPHIYLSEWVASRFDCGCEYRLGCKLIGNKMQRSALEGDLEINELYRDRKQVAFTANEAFNWQKVELLVKDYPKGVSNIIFEHEGKDSQFWKGHYGCKMAGGVVKILFDSMIKPLKPNKELLGDYEEPTNVF